jgi:hypothetical protein
MSVTARDIVAAVTGVTKEWARQRKAEYRGSRSRQSREYVYSDRTYFTDVIDAILPPAYEHASGHGRFTVSKRHLFYACRAEFQEQTGQELKYNYFAKDLLVRYLNRNPDATAGWKLTADPRGTLIVPNAGREVRVPVGTVQIDQHLRRIRRAVDLYDVPAGVDVQWPSLAPGQRYHGVLYIEKEGFDPMLKEARIAERFDLAVISCKGQSVAAARRYVDEACAAHRGVPLLVAHDFDKHGFEIFQCLTAVSDAARERDLVVYEFEHEIDCRDLGLRLEDVEGHRLPPERCRFKGSFGLDTTATKEEQAYLRRGQRVELNAFTAPQFIAWLEGKIREHLRGRLVPADGVLAAAYRRAWVLTRVNRAMAAARGTAIQEAQQAAVPKGLRRKLQQAMKANPDKAWDVALYEIVKEEIGGGA